MRTDRSSECDNPNLPNCDGGRQCYDDNGTTGCRSSCMCFTCTKGKCRPSMGNRGITRPDRYVFKKKIEAYEMSRFELALFKKGEKFLQSATFKKISDKIGVKYGFNPVIPDMSKVRLNKRLKVTGGLYYFDTQHIDISYSVWKRDKKEAYRILKHEIVHLYVDFNDCIPQSNRNGASSSTFEKTCMFAFGFNGDHGAYPYMYTCTKCGGRQKVSDKKESLWCKHCRITLVSKKEYNKILKIIEIDSKNVQVNITRYSLFKETVLIDI